DSDPRRDRTGEASHSHLIRPPSPAPAPPSGTSGRSAHARVAGPRAVRPAPRPGRFRKRTVKSVRYGRDPGFRHAAAGSRSGSLGSGPEGEMAGDRGGVRVATRTLDDEAVRDFESRLRGRLVRPSDADYDRVRAVWNGMIDKRPALVARCAGTADVIEAVRFARSEGVPVAVRGGGHNVAGGAVC